MHPCADTIDAVIEQVFGPGHHVRSIDDVDRGRGVFSHVLQCTIDGRDDPVAVKLLRADANGAAAIAMGAAAREVLAYESILPATQTVCVPRCHGIAYDNSGRPAFVLEDLSGHRWSDQLDGLSDLDVRAVVTELIALHVRWTDASTLSAITVRRSTPSGLSDDGIDAGLHTLERLGVQPTHRDALTRLADVRAVAVRSFNEEGGATLCHGDPRADNVAFATGGRAVLFDWQQMAIQFGEADLAWLMATSVTPAMRSAIESDVVASYAIARGQDAATTWRRYVLGMVLPGLSVLFLAQRSSSDDRTRQFIDLSIQRIATAVEDLDVVGLISS